MCPQKVQYLQAFLTCCFLEILPTPPSQPFRYGPPLTFKDKWGFFEVHCKNLPVGGDEVECFFSPGRGGSGILKVFGPDFVGLE